MIRKRHFHNQLVGIQPLIHELNSMNTSENQNNTTTQKWMQKNVYHPGVKLLKNYKQPKYPHLNRELAK